MARIKIEDLPLLEELTAQEMQGIVGGDCSGNWGTIQYPVPSH
jgi:hypothetical protein